MLNYDNENAQCFEKSGKRRVQFLSVDSPPNIKIYNNNTFISVGAT